MAQAWASTRTHTDSTASSTTSVDLTAAERLARFAAGVLATPLDERLRAKVQQLVVDQIGLQVAGCDFPWSQAVYDYALDTSTTGRSTIICHGTKCHPEQASFVNATFGHAQDFDDTCMEVQTHVGAVVMPTAIAVGEHVGASGEEVLRAAAAGSEVMLRAAHAVSPDCLLRGHHTPPAAGPFGAAIAAGLLVGLDEERLAQAMAIAGSFSGGLLEYTQGGGSVKRIHMAIPTTAGIRAALLAKRGMTGPPGVLDGSRGFCRVFADNPAPERLTDGLGERYLIDLIGLKAYNCCYFIHAPLEALLNLRQAHGLDPSEIVRVEVGLSTAGKEHVGVIQRPKDALGAQFSVAFSLALGLLEGPPGSFSYTEEQLADERLHEFASRVHVYKDATATAEYPGNWGGVVTVVTPRGSFTERVRWPRGTPQNPMSDKEVRDKFFANTTAAFGGTRAAEVYDCLSRLPSLPAITDLTALLTR
jgi:2-methylcitrate dehydratase PrpD